ALVIAIPEARQLEHVARHRPAIAEFGQHPGCLSIEMWFRSADCRAALRPAIDARTSPVTLRSDRPPRRRSLQSLLSSNSPIVMASTSLTLDELQQLIDRMYS